MRSLSALLSDCVAEHGRHSHGSVSSMTCTYSAALLSQSLLVWITVDGINPMFYIYICIRLSRICLVFQFLVAPDGCVLVSDNNLNYPPTNAVDASDFCEMFLKFSIFCMVDWWISKGIGCRFPNIFTNGNWRPNVFVQSAIHWISGRIALL